MWIQFLGWEDHFEERIATHNEILENPMDRGAWWAKSMELQSRTRLND